MEQSPRPSQVRSPHPEAHQPTVGYLVWRLSMKWRTAVDAAVAPLGLTHAQYSALASLRGLTRSGSRPSQRELADHTGLDPIYVSKLARTLEGAGLIVRVPDGRDARAVRLAITESGIEVIDRAIVIVHDLLEQLTAPLGGVSSDRVQALKGELERLIAAPVIAAPVIDVPVIDVSAPLTTATTRRKDNQT